MAWATVKSLRRILIPGHLKEIRRTIWSRPPFKGNTNYKIVTPGMVSTQANPSEFPLSSVPQPSYSRTMLPPNIEETDPIEIKSPEAIEMMRKSCALARKILIEAGELLRVGMTTDEIDQFVFDMCMAHRAYPSPLNYRGYPKAVCTSVNNVVCHGIPDDRPLANGDIINIDVTVFLNGYHGDCSKTFLVGDVDEAGQRLVAVAEECLSIGLGCCSPGRPFNEIGEQIYQHAMREGFSVVGAFTGHGIGSYFHGPPDIYHVPNDYEGNMLPGMTFTIEPAISEGSDRIVILEDGWTAVTCDHSRAAQCEHTVLVTNSGIEILTQ